MKKRNSGDFGSMSGKSLLNNKYFLVGILILVILVFAIAYSNFSSKNVKLGPSSDPNCVPAELMCGGIIGSVTCCDEGYSCVNDAGVLSPTGTCKNTAGGVIGAPLPASITSMPVKFIDSCQAISTPGNYILTKDLIYAGGSTSCINIGSDNVIIDGNGFKILYPGATQTSIGTGISFKGKLPTDAKYKNIIIKNLVITGMPSYGIVFNNVEGALVTDSVFKSNTEAIIIQNSKGVLVQYSLISSSIHGIKVIGSSTETIVKSNVVCDILPTMDSGAIINESSVAVIENGNNIQERCSSLTTNIFFECSAGQLTGDLNNNGFILNNDASSLLLFAESGLSVPLGTEICCVDVNSDGKVDYSDARMIFDERLIRGGSYIDYATFGKGRCRFADSSKYSSQLIDFTPILGYYHPFAGGMVILWNSMGLAYVEDKNGFLPDAWGSTTPGRPTGFPVTFNPSVGYYTPFNNGKVNLWNAVGEAYSWTNSGTWALENKNFWKMADGTSASDNLKSFKPVVGYYHGFAKGIVSLWNASGNVFVWSPSLGSGGFALAGWWTETPGKVGMGLPDGKAPIIGYYAPFGRPKACLFNPVGDLNNDLKVDQTDIDKLNEILTSTSYCSYFECGCADINGDGVVNATDGQLIYSIANNQGLPGGNAKIFVDLWYYENSQLKLYRWNGDENFVDKTSTIRGLPEGKPSAGYYDAIKNKIVLWYGLESYEAVSNELFVKTVICKTNADCATGEECGLDNLCSKIVVTCTSNADCATGETCNSDGVCVSGGGPAQCAVAGEYTSTGKACCEHLGSFAVFSSLIDRTGILEERGISPELSDGLIVTSSTTATLKINNEVKELTLGEEFTFSQLYGVVYKLDQINYYSAGDSRNNIKIILTDIGKLCYEPNLGTPVCKKVGNDKGWYYVKEGVTGALLKADLTCAELAPCRFMVGNVETDLPARARIKDGNKIKFCDPITQTSVEAKLNNADCVNDYECESNVCVEGKCYSLKTELTAQRGLLTRIWCFLIHPVDFSSSGNAGQTATNNNYLQCLAG